MWINLSPADWNIVWEGLTFASDIKRTQSRNESQHEAQRLGFLKADSFIRLANQIQSDQAKFDEADPYVVEARSQHHIEGECEIDDWAIPSEGEGGAYVMAWIWVDSDDAGLTFTCEDCSGCFTLDRKGEEGFCDECWAKAMAQEQAEMDADAAEDHAQRESLKNVFTVRDWQYDVTNGDTKRGYEDWVDAKIEDLSEAERIQLASGK